MINFNKGDNEFGFADVYPDEGNGLSDAEIDADVESLLAQYADDLYSGIRVIQYCLYVTVITTTILLVLKTQVYLLLKKKIRNQKQL